MNRFEEQIRDYVDKGLCSKSIDIIQVNVGLRCNQHCRHCHLECSPHRKEVMEWPTMKLILEASRKVKCRFVDITGGAPELHPHLREFVQALRDCGTGVQVRTNLTVLLEPVLEDLPEFFKDHQVQLVASMPCYLEHNVDTQRGAGTYKKSIKAIQRLNSLGYGVKPDLALHLVYNPLGPSLPPDQTSLETDYRKQLRDRFSISFSSLVTITNMPIGKFLKSLHQQNKVRDYHKLLEESFNPQTIPHLMCRHLISVGWDGRLYDCDFNLALGYPVNHGAPDHIRNFEPRSLSTRRIVTGEYCFGCTAGCGSSCGGSLV